jgi:hypothetical protein
VQRCGQSSQVLRRARARFRRVRVRFAEGVCREERGEGGIYRWASVGEGLEFGGVLRSDGGGDVRARAGLRRGGEEADKWGPLVSGSAARDAYRFGRTGLAGWAGFGAWAELVPRGLLPIFLKHFSFLVLKQI